VSGIPFFLRFDDITDLDERIIQLVENSLANTFPVLVAVIPDKLHSDAAKWLIGLRGKYPHLLDIAQHGYRHRDHFPGITHGEFCKSRPNELIDQDLLAGMAMMDNAFGGEWQRIFVPPFNHVSRYTIRTLIRMRFLGVSTFHFPVDNLRERIFMCRNIITYQFGSALPAQRNMWRIEGQLPCVSPVIDTVADYTDPRPASIDKLDAMVNSMFLKRVQVFGIMMHHWVYRDKIDIENMLKWVKSIRDRFELTPVTVTQLMQSMP